MNRDEIAFEFAKIMLDNARAVEEMSEIPRGAFALADKFLMVASKPSNAPTQFVPIGG